MAWIVVSTFYVLLLVINGNCQDARMTNKARLDYRDGPLIFKYENDKLVANKALDDYLDSNEVPLYPYMMGATLEEFENLSSERLVQKPLPDLLPVASTIFHPAQIRALSNKIDWSVEENRESRFFVRPFLALEQISATLDGTEEVFDDEWMPWASILRIAHVMSMGSTVDLKSKFLAISFPSEIEAVLDGQVPDFESVASERLSRGQAQKLLYPLTLLDDPIEDQNVELPNSVLKGLDAGNILEMSRAVPELIEHYPQFLPAQKFATYYAILERNKGSLLDSIPFLAAQPELFQFVDPQDAKALKNATMTAIRDQTSVAKAGGYSNYVMALPKYLQMAVNSNLTTSIRFFHDNNKPTPILSLTCKQVSEYRPVAISYVLTLQYAQIQSGKQAVSYPLSLRNCALDVFRQVMGTGDDGKAEEQEAIDRMPELGGYVLTGLSIAELDIIRSRFGDGFAANLTYEIGKLPQIELMALLPLSRLRELSLHAEEESFRLMGYPRKLYYMGSLVHFSRLQLRTTEPRFIKDLVRKIMSKKFHRTVCLPKINRGWWAKALIRAYGPIQSWNAEDLHQIGDLLITLTPEQLERISVTELRLAVPYLLEHSRFHDHFDVQPSFSNSTHLYKACLDWLRGNEAKSFEDHFMALQRLYLRASQLSVDLASQDASSKAKRSLPVSEDIQFEDIFGQLRSSFRLWRTSRQKRQIAVDNSVQELVLQRISVAVAFIMENSNDPVLNAQIRGAYEASRINALGLFRQNLDLPTSLTWEETVAQIRELRDKNQVSPTIENALDQGMTNILFNTAKELMRITQLTPEVLRLDRAQVCILFEDLDTCINGVPVDPDQEVEAPLVTTPTPTNPPTVPITLPPTTIPPVPLQEPVVPNRDQEFSERRDPVDFEPPPGNFDGLSPFDIRDSTLFAGESLPEEFTCHGVKAAEKSAVALNAQDIAAWSPKEVEKCLEVLGYVEWSLSEKFAVWQAIRSKNIPNFRADKMSSHDMVALNGLLEAVALASPGLLDLNMTHVDAISILGRFKFNLDVLQRLARQIHDDSNGVRLPIKTKLIDDASVFSSLIAVSMNHLICGEELENVKRMLEPEKVWQKVFPVLSRMQSCPSKEVLGLLAQKAVEKYGPPHTWDGCTVSFLGIIVAGLSPTEFRSISKEVKYSIMPAAFSHINHDHLSDTLASDLDHFADESLAKIELTALTRSEEKSAISEDFIEKIKAMDEGGHTGLKDLMETYEKLVDVMDQARDGSNSLEPNVGESKPSSATQVSQHIVVMSAFAILVVMFS